MGMSVLRFGGRAALAAAGLGLATTVAASWALAWTQASPIGSAFRVIETFVPGASGDRLVSSTHLIGVSEYWVRAIGRDGVVVDGCWMRHVDPAACSGCVGDLPAWIRTKRISEVEEDRSLASFGWPARALWCGADWGDNWRLLSLEPIASVRVTEEGERSVWWAGLLPIGVIWKGMIVNSVVYGTAWLCGIVGVAGLRRMRRERRGLCVACAYDLRGTVGAVCPECGREHGGLRGP